MPDVTWHQQNDGTTVMTTWFTKDEQADEGLLLTGEYFALDDGTQVPTYMTAGDLAAPIVSITPAASAAGSRPTTPGDSEIMSTTTIERPAVLTAPAARVNGAPMRAHLDEGVKVGYGDRLRSIPRRLRAWVRSVWETARGTQIKGAMRSGLGSARSLLGRVLAPVRAIGPWNIVGALLTCQQGRDLVRKVADTVVRVVTAPFRLVGKGIAWVLNKFGWGRKVVAATQQQAIKTGEWVATKFDAGMTWLDEREFAGGMRWARAYFQGKVMGGLIRSFVPKQYRTGAYIASLFVPTLGVRGGGTESKTTLLNATEARVADEAERIAKAAASPAAPAPSVHVGDGWTIEQAPMFDGTTESIVSVMVDRDGDRWVKIDGTLYALGEIPNGTLIGEAARKAAKQAREADSVAQSVAATTAGVPQNREQKRAAQKATGRR